MPTTTRTKRATSSKRNTARPGDGELPAIGQLNRWAELVMDRLHAKPTDFEIPPTAGEARRQIALLEAATPPAPASRPRRESVGFGIYMHNGELVRVRPNQRTRDLPRDQWECYAEILRGYTDSGRSEGFRWSYERGLLFDLTDGERVPLSRETMAIMSNHHHCLVDNHVLTGRVTRAALGDCADYFAR